MRRFSKCGISRWLVVLLITIFATGNLLAGKVCTDTFATAYNEIIRGYENKGGNLGYARKGAFDIVTCEDVAFLRGLVGSLVPQYIEKVDLSKYTASEAFPPFQFNDGRGFLVVPAQYAGADYYTNDSVQFNPPVLWCHFIDMANILNKMKYKREGSIISILCAMTSSVYEYFPGEPPGLLSNDHYEGPTNNFGSFSSERKQSSLGSLNPYWCVRWDSRADTSYSLTFSLPNNLHRDSAVFYLLMNDSFYSYHACPYGDLDYYFYNSTDSWQSYANIVNNGTLNVAFAPISVGWDDPAYHEPYCSNNVNGSRASAYNTIISIYNDKVLVIPGEDECAKDGIYDDCLCGGCGTGTCSISNGQICVETTTVLAGSSSSSGDGGQASRIDLSRDTLVASLGGDYAAPGAQPVLRVKAYFTQKTSSDGITSTMFSLDTTITNDVVSSDGNGHSINFVTLRRASGKSVTFGILNGVGIPDNGASYRLKKITENEIVRYEVFYPENNTTQHFNASGKLYKLAAEINGGTQQVQTDANGNWPGMTVNRDTEGKVAGVVTASGNAEPVLDTSGKMTGMKYYNPQGILYRRTANVEGVETVADGTAHYIIYREYDGSDNLLKERKVTNYPNNDVKEEIFNISGGTAGSVASTTLTATSVVNDLSLATTTVTRGSSVAVTATRTKAFPWGANVVESIVAPGTSDEKTTVYNYYDNKDTDGNNYGKLKSQINPDGSWARYEYDSEGRMIKEAAPFGNAAVDAADSLCRVTTYDYTPLSSGLTPVPGDTRARTIVTTVLGTEVSRKYNEYFADEEVNAVCKTAGAAWDASDNIVTHKYSYSSGDFKGKLRKVTNADGTMSVYTYSISSGSLETTVKSGSGSGDTVTSGTSTVSVINAAGNPVSNTVTDIASGLTLSSETYTLDDFGRITRTDYLGGTYSTTVYGCCGPTQQTAQDGSVTTMAYTALSQLDHSATAGITTFYTYDALGNKVSITVKGTDNSEQTTTKVYNAAGQLVSTTTPGNKTTTYAESWADGIRYRTTTYPGGSTRVEKYNADGTLAEISGTAVHPVKYEYGVENNQFYKKEIKVGDNNALDQWQKSFVNMAARVYKTIYADNSFAQAFFDSANRQIKQISPSGVVNLTAYNADSEVSASAFDMNRNDTIDYSGPDRVTGYSKAVANKNGVTVRRNVTSVYQDSSSTPTEASVSEVSADGLNSWQTSFGQVTTSQTVLNGSGQRTITVTNPDGSTVSSVYQNGMMSSSTHSVLGTTTYAYDAFNRPLTITRTENGVQKTVTYAYNDAGQTVSITETPGNRVTSYVYDNMGRRTSAAFPGSRTVNYTYADTGEYLTVTGADTYPQAFTYDTQGRMKTLTTYKAYPGTPEVTTWNYDSARGFLISKVYPDNKQVTYTNDADGRMLTRIWARGITTTYVYDNGGSLTGVSYSDGTTTASSYTLDRMGRVTAVTDASGSRTLNYNADGTLASESIPYIVSGTVEYTYDSLGRRTGLQLKQNSLPVFGNSYTYDAMSRLATVSDGTNTATYSRIAGTNLLNTTTITAGGVTKLTTSLNYDTQNRLTSIFSVAGAVTKTYSYTYDDKDRRSRLDMADGSYWTYAYDAKGQIVSGTKYDSTGKAIPGQAFNYSYDDIGNLTSEQRGMTEMQFDYTSNLVNQYTQRLVPGIIPVTGQASADSTVSVWLKNHGANAAAVTRPTRDGEYFKAAIPVNNSTASVTEALEITAVKFNTTLDKDVVKTINGSYTVPKTPQVFTYDDDGNMIGDCVWTYTWNGENRLIAAEKAYDKKLEFIYDYQGRRTEKKVYSWISNTWSLTKYLKFVYDGYKQIAEYDGTAGTMQKNCTWQPERAGQDVPLWLVISGNTYYYAVDGNKSIRAMVDGAGALVAEYEYSPFGETLSKSGAMADVNPFRFSSEYYDLESGLIYYNYRYYSPDLRRWLSRDPIEEKGGENLYGFCVNSSINLIDELGNGPNDDELIQNLDNGAAISNLIGELNTIYEKLKARRVELQNNQLLRNERHCIMSCEMTKEYGRFATRIAGLVNEITGLILWDIPQIRSRINGSSEWAFQLSDFAENESGIWCALQRPNVSCEECCKCTKIE